MQRTGSEAAHRDRFAERVHARVVETSAERAVVDQPDVPELGNHMGVRHAGALYAAAYEASRALVTAALGELADSVELFPWDSEIAYEAIAAGPVTSVAEPSGAGWADLAAGSPARSSELATEVTSRNAGDEIVLRLVLVWRITPTGGQGKQGNSGEDRCR